jgi:26S proteasome regulatory subunit T1
MRLACTQNLRLYRTAQCSSQRERTPARLRRLAHLSRTPEPLVPGLAGLLQSYDELEPQPIPLSKLLSFGSPVSPSSVLASASYTRSEIPRRLARSVRNLDRLPYICGTNPYIARIHDLYLSTFSDLASAAEITNIEENDAFSALLARRVDLHADDIPTMSKG